MFFCILIFTGKLVPHAECLLHLTETNKQTNKQTTNQTNKQTNKNVTEIKKLFAKKTYCVKYKFVSINNQFLDVILWNIAVEVSKVSLFVKK